MKTTKGYVSALVAFMVVGVVLILVFSLAGPALSSTALTALLAPTPPPCDPIPLKPVTGLTSMDATVNIDVNGKINGKKAQGNLKGLVTTNDQSKSKVTISGPLLGDIAAQVGGSVVGLFTPSKVDVYKMPDGAYIVINGLVPVCVKPKMDKSTAALDDVSPQALLGMLTGSDVACGKFVGDETLNGAAVKHYVIDGEAFLAAAQNSDDEKLREFADALYAADDADLYVDAKGGYPVAFKGNYSGAFEPLKFEGDFGVDIQVTDVNRNTPVALPASCKNPISK
jgi:hypothetical protein